MNGVPPFDMNRYWIPRLDIHKKIIVQELPYFLGPEATVRPYTNDVSSNLHSRFLRTDKTAGGRWFLDQHSWAMPDRCEASLCSVL